MLEDIVFCEAGDGGGFGGVVLEGWSAFAGILLWLIFVG